jgi:radical SAM protein with 4Fe4S-binding SPASM domain
MTLTPVKTGKKLLGKGYLDLVGRLALVPFHLLRRHLLRPIRIESFNFEVTRRCNGRCTYCNIWRTPSKPELELKPDEIREYLKPAKLFSRVQLIGVTGGEPFLRSDLVDLCQALREACPNAHLGFVTNGLNPELTVDTLLKIRSEVDPKLVCGVSIDGFSDYDAATRNDSRHYNSAWKTVFLLSYYGIPVGIGSTLTESNIHVAPHFKRWVEARGIPYAFEIASTSIHYYDNVEFRELTGREYLPVIEELSRGGSTFSHYQPKYFVEKRQLFPCFSGFASFFLNCYGEVYPCIHLPYSFGNLRQTPSFKYIWHGPRAREARKLIRDKRCHCWTSCEAGATIRTLIYPALLKKLELKFKFKF